MSGSGAVIVGGSRTFSSYEVVEATLDAWLPKAATLVFGDARGADALAGRYAREHELNGIRYEADWERHGKRAGSLRNTEMLDSCEPELVVSFVEDPTSSPGTANMVLQALTRGVRVLLVSREGKRTWVRPEGESGAG